jgi:filamentous hemagglutinin
MTKPLHQLYLLLPLVFITWWTLTFGFKTTTYTNQTQNVSTISKDTNNAHFTMTEINTEVLEIRADISKEVAVDGFEAVGDYAMKQKASGDKEWEDGGTKKTIAHAAMGAIVAGIGDGDALDGAAGAGAREATSNLSAGKDDTTQQWISSAIGGVAGGATGASVALQGENIIDNFIKKR